MYIIELTKTKLVKNPNTKTTFMVKNTTVETITEQQYNYATSKDTVKFFKNLGGKESLTKSYTCAGFKVTKIVSVSPDGQNKTVREYKFKTL